MTVFEYQRAAARTIPADVAVSCRSMLTNAALGIAGEGGECCDVVKKWLYQGHELDRDHLIEELGDELWYVAMACEGLSISMERVMQRNIDKLLKRYPRGFETEKSINRPEYTEDRTCGLVED